MEHIPKQKVGNRVRVLQTDTMKRFGLANLNGTVMKILGEDNFHGQACLVKFNPNDFPCPIMIYSCTLSEIKKSAGS